MVRQCSAHNAQGEQCKRGAMLGTTVCAAHGGLAPHVKAAAAARLTEALPVIVERLHAMLEEVRKDAPACVMCGRGMPRSEEFLLKVMTTVMDRAGMGPSAKVEVHETISVEFVEYLKEDELELIDGLIELAKERAAKDLAGA